MIRSGSSRRHWPVWAIALVLAVLVSGCPPPPPPPPPPPETTPSEPGTTETGVVIVLVDGKDPIPKSCRIERSQNQDHVRWDNQTSVDRTITFQPGIWPFEEAQMVVTVPANGKSHWFTIGSSLQLRQYMYHVDPPLIPGGPPGEPDITGGN